MERLSEHELRGLMKRAERNREQLGPQRGPGPGLPLSMRCDPAFVTGLDLFDFPQGLAQSHRRELLRRRVPRVTPPVDVLVLNFLALFNGLRPGGGTWVQLPVRQEEGIVGYGESTLQASHKRLVDRGFVERQEQMRELKWVDEDGRVHFRVEVWAKMRITPAGLEYLRTLGQSRRVIVPVAAQRSTRVSVVVGLSTWLLKACGALFRMLARRFAGAFEMKAPPKGKTLSKEEPVEGAPARRAPGSSTAATDPSSRTHGPSPPDAGACGSRGDSRAYQRDEIARLKGIQAITVARAYPQYWDTDRYGRRTLEQHFRELYQAELHRWFVETSTPAMRRIQSMRDAEDAEQLEAFEAAEPSESEKRRRYHKDGLRWQPHGRGVPGGEWKPAAVLSIEELKKVQAAKRDAGELPPKKRRSRV